MANESGQSEMPLERAVGKKAKVSLEMREQQLAPRASFWPIALALTLAITAIGLMIHPVLFVCGIVLTFIVIIGWILEKH